MLKRIKFIFKRVICLLTILGLITPILEVDLQTVRAKTLTRRISLDPIPGVGVILGKH